MPVFLKGTLQCDTAGQAARVRAALPAHIALTRAEPGCVHFTVSATEDPMVWRVEEEFVDQNAFEAHQARTQNSPWAEETHDVARNYRITEAP